MDEQSAPDDFTIEDAIDGLHELRAFPLYGDLDNGVITPPGSHKLDRIAAAMEWLIERHLKQVS